MNWESEFRHRLNRFEAVSNRRGKSKGVSLSIKIRVTGGCFHREHSPEAYKIIDHYIRSHPSDEVLFQEHESRPELLVYLSLGAAVLSLSAGIINFVTAVIKARSDGVKRGDRPNQPIELIVRGFTENGQLKEEKILRFGSQDTVSKTALEEALHNSLRMMFPSKEAEKETRRITQRKRSKPKP